jgi:hypothetical protein
MTTEELLWNATFEQNDHHSNTSYNYEEEWAMERYYEDRELFERFAEYLRPTG